MQWLFQTLRSRGFRVFLVTGRDEETLGSCTAANLAAAGFSGYDRLIMRYARYRLSSLQFFIVCRGAAYRGHWRRNYT